MADDPTARALQLLSLLSARPVWAGEELARRLDVTDRTVRRDVDRLRSLGYRIDATTGTAGGYRLVAGADLPPLFFDDDEAVAVVAALLVALGGVTGMVDGSTRALGKLHHVLPPRLQRRASALHDAARAGGATFGGGPQVDPALLLALAEAVRDGLLVRFAYAARDGAASERRVEPVHLLTTNGVWYLVAYDLDRADWRVFRVDRMADGDLPGHRFAPRPVPGGDPGALVAAAIARTPYPHTATVRVDAPAAAVLDRHVGLLDARTTDHGDGTSTVRLGAATLDALAAQLLDLLATDLGATLVDASPAVRARLDAVGRRFLALAAASPADPSP